MKITIESTTKIVELKTANGASLPARVWEGKTDTGVEVIAFITRIAVSNDFDHEQFQKELQSCKVPTSAVQAFDMRYFID